jgi:uncharacterized iron-regulated membrane protein
MRSRMRRFLYRTHIWLAWLVGVPLLFWTVSGLVMTALPIDEVRGAHLRRPASDPPLATLTAPLVAPETLLRRAGPGGDSLTLRWLAGRPVWELRGAGEPMALFDARTGAPLRLDAVIAAALARSRHAGGAAVRAVERVDPAAPPLDFRRDTPAFRVRFDDRERTIFYLDARNGDLLAVRTDRWRLFDLMWGLHIMDLKGREDMNHPTLVAFAALSALCVAAALALLWARTAAQRRARRPRPGGGAVAPAATD